MNDKQGNSQRTQGTSGAQPRHACPSRLVERAADGVRIVRHALAVALITVVVAAGVMVRWTVAALLVLIEPVLRITLLPMASLGFMVTLVFGFLMGDPRYPKWGMLAMSIGCLLAYWLFILVMMVVVGGSRGRH